MASRSEEEQALMLRLKSQFGDLDLSTLVNEQKNAEADNDQSEESSLAEPSEEELRAWQEAQFKRGQMSLELKKKDEIKSAIQKRREDLKKKQRNEDTEGVTDDDWEQITALPDLGGQASMFFPTETQDSELLGVHPILQELVSEGPEPDLLGTTWKQLYSSAHGDGLSFVKLLDKIRGYPGPTVMLIGAVPPASKRSGSSSKTEPWTSTIGFFTASPWIESPSFTGSSDCFLFAFDCKSEKIKFFKVLEKPDRDLKSYMYCHPSTLKAANVRGAANTSKKTDGLVHGLGVGGTALQPRLHLTETFEDCRAMNYCRLFEDGDLLLGHAQASLNYFDVDCIEVWAVGGEEWINESMARQRGHRDVYEANLVNARTVKDKKQFINDLAGGLLNSKSNGFFAHNFQTTERCDL